MDLEFSPFPPLIDFDDLNDVEQTHPDVSSLSSLVRPSYAISPQLDQFEDPMNFNYGSDHPWRWSLFSSNSPRLTANYDAFSAPFVSATASTPPPISTALQKDLQGAAHKDKAKPFVCPFSGCGKAYMSKESLKTHTRIHTDQAVQCPQCWKRFPYQSKLELHLRVHSGARPFECSHCNKKFGDKSNLMRHIRTHTNEKPFVCSDCKKAYSDKSALVDHQRRHHAGVKAFVCRQCNKLFNTPSDLKSHAVVHSESRPYRCHECDKCFKRLQDLKKHKNTKVHLQSVSLVNESK